MRSKTGGCASPKYKQLSIEAAPAGTTNERPALKAKAATTLPARYFKTGRTFQPQTYSLISSSHACKARATFQKATFQKGKGHIPAEQRMGKNRTHRVRAFDEEDLRGSVLRAVAFHHGHRQHLLLHQPGRTSIQRGAGVPRVTDESKREKKKYFCFHHYIFSLLCFLLFARSPFSPTSPFSRG